MFEQFVINRVVEDLIDNFLDFNLKKKMCLRDAIYPVPQGCACFMLILNIILPGSGTMLQSFFGGRKCPLTFFVGLLQLLSVALLLFGWCWAIWHAEMVRCVSSPDHLGRPAPETELEETEKAKDAEQEA